MVQQTAELQNFKISKRETSQEAISFDHIFFGLNAQQIIIGLQVERYFNMRAKLLLK